MKNVAFFALVLVGCDFTVPGVNNLLNQDVDLALHPIGGPVDMAVQPPPDLIGLDLVGVDLTITPVVDFSVPPDLIGLDLVGQVLPDLIVFPDFTILPQSCKDGVRNGNETDIDCGGINCSTCAHGKACLVNADCRAGSCQGNVCDSLCTVTNIDPGLATCQMHQQNGNTVGAAAVVDSKGMPVTFNNPAMDHVDCIQQNGGGQPPLGTIKCQCDGLLKSDAVAVGGALRCTMP